MTNHSQVSFVAMAFVSRSTLLFASEMTKLADFVQ